MLESPLTLFVCCPRLLIGGLLDRPDVAAPPQVAHDDAAEAVAKTAAETAGQAEAEAAAAREAATAVATATKGPKGRHKGKEDFPPLLTTRKSSKATPKWSVVMRKGVKKNAAVEGTNRPTTGKSRSRASARVLWRSLKNEPLGCRLLPSGFPQLGGTLASIMRRITADVDLRLLKFRSLTSQGHFGSEDRRGGRIPHGKPENDGRR